LELFGKNKSLAISLSTIKHYFQFCTYIVMEFNDGSSFETNRRLHGLEPSMTFNAIAIAETI
jgi:hypothetical protein